MLSLSQERAERTRHRLIRAAAAEFSRFGYQGTSLVRISKAAGVTMGALTFHFPVKGDLADAVCADAKVAARSAIEHAHTTDEPPLQTVVNITHAMAGLLREEDTVRAAVRLCRDSANPGQTQFSDLWMPSARRMLCQAQTDRTLHPDATPDVVANLVAALVAALELSAPRLHSEQDTGSSLSAVWNLLIPAISTGGHTVHPYSTATAGA